MNHIVVWDPEEKLAEGTLIDFPAATVLAGRGGLALPASPELYQMAGNGGFDKRVWGQGLAIADGVPRMYSPLGVFVTRAHRIVHWAARLLPTAAFVESAKEKAPDSPGSLSLAAMPTRGNVQQAPLTPRTNPTRIRDYGPCDKFGGWTITGNAFANVATDGYYSFALYGAGAGVRVAWAAISIVSG